MLWISSAPPDDLVWMLLPMLLLDGTRYTGMTMLMWLVDQVRGVRPDDWEASDSPGSNDLPSVAVMIVGLNEGNTIQHALQSIYGSYPRMEIFVVSDGSTDGMESKAQAFARQYSGVTVLHRPRRGGKSSAMNMVLPLVRAEIVVVIDSDSHLEDHAIYQIVQPFRDAQVGAVSGCVSARNPFHGLATYLQAFEYRRSIFLGRLVLSRINLLGIVSGAFGAFRKSALDQVGGWDVGPGEDGDLTLKLRKAGYRIAFQPRANCFTNVPTRWTDLLRQRRRWEWAAVTFECRKHVDLGNPLAHHFRWSNFCLALERWLYGFVLVFLSVFSFALLLATTPFGSLVMVLSTIYLAYAVCESIQYLVLLQYSANPWSDGRLGFAILLMPAYCALMKLVTFFALSEELLRRRSYRDDFVPQRVRQATWHW